VFFFTSLGVTAVLGGVTVWKGLDTRNHPGRDAVQAGCVDQGEACALYQEGLSNQRTTNILLGATLGAAAVTGVLAFVTNWQGATDKQGSAGAALRLSPGLGGPLGLSAAGRF
jgi:hypothetical protein